MITTTKYIEDTVRLIKSLIILSIDTAIQINNELVKIYGTSILGDEPEDRTTWKYFMNISGEYHKLDHRINITIIEDGSVQKLTKELLDKYKTTRNELKKFDTYYNDLVAEYPEDELLIKGIIYGLDINDVINCTNGELVAHSPYLVEEQETNLIHRLNEFSKNYFLRWHIRDYGIIDDLYIPSLLATLYTKMVLKTLNIRQDYIFTSEAHSFHIYEFFRSNYGIDVDVKVLSKETRFWLYKNLRYIKNNIGKNKTLDILIEKILTENGIGVAEVELLNGLPDEDLLNLTDITKPIYDKKENRFISKRRNDYYLIDDNDDTSGKALLLRQFSKAFVDNDMVIKDTNFYDNTLEYKLDKNKFNKQKTKTFKIKVNRSYVVENKIELKMVLDNFIQMAFRDIYKTSITFIDNNTGFTYDLDAKQAAFLILKLLAVISGNVNPKIPSYTANKLLNSVITVDALNYNMINPTITYDIAKKLIELRPDRLTYLDRDIFNQYLKDLNSFNSVIWNIATNSNDMLINNSIKTMYKRLHMKETIIFNQGDSTIDELMANQFVDFYFTDVYDYKETLNKVLYAFTGFYFDKDDVNEMVDKYIKIVKNLSSSTIQFMNSTNSLDVMSTRYNTNMSISTPGIIDIHEGTFRALEDFYGYMAARDAPYGCFLKSDIELMIPRGYTRINPPKLMLYEPEERLALTNVLHVKNEMPDVVFSNKSYLTMFRPYIGTKINDMKDIIQLASSETSKVGRVVKRYIQTAMEWYSKELDYSNTPTITTTAGPLSFRLFSPIVNSKSDNIIQTIGSNSFNLSYGNFINDVTKFKLYDISSNVEVNGKPEMVMSTNRRLLDWYKPTVKSMSDKTMNKSDSLTIDRGQTGYIKQDSINITMETPLGIFNYSMPNITYSIGGIPDMFRPSLDSGKNDEDYYKTIDNVFNASMIPYGKQKAKVKLLMSDGIHSITGETSINLIRNIESSLNMYSPKIGSFIDKNNKESTEYFKDTYIKGIAKDHTLKTRIENYDSEMYQETSTLIANVPLKGIDFFKPTFTTDTLNITLDLKFISNKFNSNVNIKRGETKLIVSGETGLNTDNAMPTLVMNTSKRLLKWFSPIVSGNINDIVDVIDKTENEFIHGSSRTDDNIITMHVDKTDIIVEQTTMISRSKKASITMYSPILLSNGGFDRTFIDGINTVNKLSGTVLNTPVKMDMQLHHDLENSTLPVLSFVSEFGTVNMYSPNISMDKKEREVLNSEIEYRVSMYGNLGKGVTDVKLYEDFSTIPNVLGHVNKDVLNWFSPIVSGITNDEVSSINYSASKTVVMGKTNNHRNMVSMSVISKELWSSEISTFKVSTNNSIINMFNPIVALNTSVEDTTLAFVSNFTKGFGRVQINTTKLRMYTDDILENNKPTAIIDTGMRVLDYFKPNVSNIYNPLAEDLVPMKNNYGYNGSLNNDHNVLTMFNETMDIESSNKPNVYGSVRKADTKLYKPRSEVFSINESYRIVAGSFDTSKGRYINNHMEVLLEDIDNRPNDGSKPVLRGSRNYKTIDMFSPKVDGITYGIDEVVRNPYSENYVPMGSVTGKNEMMFYNTSNVIDGDIEPNVYFNTTKNIIEMYHPKFRVNSNEQVDGLDTTINTSTVSGTSRSDANKITMDINSKDIWVDVAPIGKFNTNLSTLTLFKPDFKTGSVDEKDILDSIPKGINYKGNVLQDINKIIMYGENGEISEYEVGSLIGNNDVALNLFKPLVTDVISNRADDIDGIITETIVGSKRVKTTNGILLNMSPVIAGDLNPVLYGSVNSDLDDMFSPTSTAKGYKLNETYTLTTDTFTGTYNRKFVKALLYSKDLNTNNDAELIGDMSSNVDMFKPKINKSVEIVFKDTEYVVDNTIKGSKTKKDVTGIGRVEENNLAKTIVPELVGSIDNELDNMFVPVMPKTETLELEDTEVINVNDLTGLAISSELNTIIYSNEDGVDSTPALIATDGKVDVGMFKPKLSRTKDIETNKTSNINTDVVIGEINVSTTRTIMYDMDRDKSSKPNVIGDNRTPVDMYSPKLKGSLDKTKDTISINNEIDINGLVNINELKTIVYEDETVDKPNVVTKDTTEIK